MNKLYLSLCLFITAAGCTTCPATTRTSSAAQTLFVAPLSPLSDAGPVPQIPVHASGTPNSVETQTSPTATSSSCLHAITSTNAALEYTNTIYGFRLLFDEAWKDFIVTTSVPNQFGAVTIT